MTRRRRSPKVLAGAPRASAELTTLMMMAPFVIGARLMQFCSTAGAPTARDKAEATQMVSEKMQAGGESLIAMNLALAKAATDASLAAMIGRPRRAHGGDAVLAASLKPYSNCVRANRRRLQKSSSN